jgi:hypothetical protein
MTKTDNINTDEVVDSLHLGESVLKDIFRQESDVNQSIDEAEERLEEFNQQLKNLKKPPKRKHSEIDNDGSAKGADGSDESTKQQPRDQRKTLMKLQKRVEKEIRELKAELYRLEVSMKAICIDERNQYTHGRLQEDFEGGLREFIQDMDESNSGDCTVTTKGKGSLRTFCVSSKAYQKLRGRFKRDQVSWLRSSPSRQDSQN